MRRRVAMEVGGRWVVISDSISGGRVRRVGAGIWRWGVWFVWGTMVEREGGREGWGACCVCCCELLGLKAGVCLVCCFVMLISLQAWRFS